MRLPGAGNTRIVLRAAVVERHHAAVPRALFSL